VIEDEAAGAVLARAFFADPVFRWVLPRDDDRRALVGWFTGMVRWGRRFGEVHTLGPKEQPTAVAVWGSRPANTWEHVRAGLVGPTLGLGPRPLYRFLRLGAVLGGWRDRLCPEPHRYLYFLGVDPPEQNRGLGSEVVRPQLREADARGLPCYLETATESNVAFYRRLDFSVAHQGRLLPPAPQFWLLKRTPRST
jgi:ribosomal protein S18 acetylase RimI-like enzyme